jgi:ABC-type lipoprotein release transport system permease subunit
MRVIWTMAWRNTWRQRRRTLLTMSTIALGLALILLYWGLTDGTVQQMIESTARMGSGHVVIQQAGYHDSPEVERYLSGAQAQDAEAWLADMRASAPIAHVTRRTFASGLASSADGSAGVLVVGIDPERERSASRFADQVDAGRFLQPGDEGYVLPGAGVARRLAVGADDRVVLMAQSTTGDLESILVRVIGTVRTGLPDLDDRIVLVPISDAQRLLGLGAGVHQVAALLHDAGASAPLAAAGRARLQGVEVLDWSGAHPELIDMVRLLAVRNTFMSLLVFTLVAFLVFNTLLMAVMERRRELSLLDAVGLSPGRRFAMVMAEAAVIAVLASAAGFALGFAGHWYLATEGLAMGALLGEDVAIAGTVLDPVLYSHLSAARIAQTLGLVFAMTLVLALVPARRATRPGDIAHLGAR